MPDAECEDDRPVALLRLVDNHRSDAVAAHRRVSDRIKGLDARADILEHGHTDLAQRVGKLENAPPPAPPDVMQLRFSPPVVVFILSTALSIAGGMYTSTAGLRQDVSGILTQMSAKKDLDKAKEDLQNERATNVARTLEALDKQMKYQQSQLTDLSNAVLDLKRSK